MSTLAELNAASHDEFVALLAGVYEHSPWIAAAAFEQRPFTTLAALKHALVQAVHAAGRDAQLALLRAHPELAGKAMVAGTLTAESSGEQQRAGLAACTPEEFATIQRLNAAYNDRFGWPFIVAVRGPRGSGLTRTEIITTLQRRLASHPEVEFAECLRQVHRIAEIRLAEKFDTQPHRGRRVWDRAEALAAFSEPPWAERGELTVTYLSAAHRDCARLLARWMQECGFDSVREDAVGNVVGVYEAATPGAPRLLTGSHYDTVRNGGCYDGRLGILVALEAVAALKAEGRRLPFAIELVAFAEEEGQRYAATFLGSSALTGDFHPAWLDQEDAAGVTMRDAMRAAGLPATLEAIAAERRDPAHYLGFVEVHIEQGPVLAELGLPLGVVTSINGSRRWTGEISGLASHAGTTPMGRRRDAACAAAEFVLAAERCAATEPDAVATVGMLEVPAGSINVVPGRCRISLDIRATTDAARDAVADAVLAELEAICARRGVGYTLTPTMQAPAAPCAPAWQARWKAAVAALGLPVQRLPSGAGHDAMTLHRLLPQAMLFVRGGELGISHNPLETVTDDDAELAVAAFATLLAHLARE
ncbi:OHCU decarboxylase [Rubrivivax gelatinosus]|uniref:2-oxo-4-hydroxy-4-carboxy-5-ureidoimidazoline decarboxylase n=1 Tax=Rubrivivax gelatinosus TaxID=28068 RepID=UPI001902E196|nr:2-oxo-4-hydroxy-4-carboxy-5-ureidoimidazoline decarboxylase [Rubrivivax gelatinosus]MBK1615910.1 OHCU decarboxylase [Rubrivivax gelatinosus]